MIKKTIPYLLFLCLLVFLFSCKENAASADSPAQGTSGMQPETAEQTEALPPVTLNNGAKWNADPATTLGIGDIKAALNEFTNETGGEDFNTRYMNLVRSCKETYNGSNMADESRTQLLNYINQLIARVEKLQSNGRADRQQTLTEINNYLNTYHDYFN